jgi:hypothetical protein
MRGDVVRFARLVIESRVMGRGLFDEQLSCVPVQEPLLADVWGGSFTMPQPGAPVSPERLTASARTRRPSR